MDDLIERLRAALDEDERLAREAHANEPRWAAYYADREYMEDPWVGYRDELGTVATGMRAETALHIARQDPKRILDMVLAHRKVMADYVTVKTIKEAAWAKMRAGATLSDQEARDCHEAESAEATLYRVLEYIAQGYGIEVPEHG